MPTRPRRRSFTIHCLTLPHPSQRPHAGEGASGWSDCWLCSSSPNWRSATPEIVPFRENPTLRGVLYKPDGPGPFPGLIYNHGSAPGMLNQQAFEALGPLFARRGWVFFAPYRRGQGLSATAGPFIGDEIASARNKGTWVGLFVAVPASLLLFLAVVRKQRRWLRIVCGVSLGLVAAMERTRAVFVRAALRWCGCSKRSISAINSTPPIGYKSRVLSTSIASPPPETRSAALKRCSAQSGPGTARRSMARVALRAGPRHLSCEPGWCAPFVVPTRQIFFFQAENDYDLSPSRTLSAEMRDAGKVFELRSIRVWPVRG